MLGPVRAHDVLGPNGLFAQRPGYTFRPSQLAMAEIVEQTLASEGVAIVEAGTGTGKTLAYLVPSVLAGARVIVSTGTRALQDQIMTHDLPLLERVLGRSLDVACLKGLANYLCLRRYDELLRSPRAVEGGLARQLPVLTAFRDETLTGDLGELEALAEDALIRAEVQSGTDTRIGPRCRFHDACFVTRARANAERAQVVVVNHHLFFADLAMRDAGAAILPPYDVVIFDEAHQLEDVATLFFGVQVSSTRIERLVRDARRAFALDRGTALTNDAGTRLAEYVGTTGAALFETLPRTTEGGRAPLDREALLGPLEPRIVALDDALHALGSHLRLRAGDDEAFAQLARRAETLRDDVLKVGEGATHSRTTWSQRTARGGAIGASPVDVSDLLRENLFYRTRSVVLTSATLATGGDFTYLKSRLGIDFPATERVLPSPFAFPEQAALYLAAHMPDPRDARYLEAATREVLALVRLTGGGAFVLCTSFRVMKALAEEARPQLDLPVMVQGEAPKQMLLDRFRKKGNAVLFATSSFWEGVDVPGDALRLVILDRLPFDVPTDPLVAARCERIRDEGDAPFTRYLLPSAAIALKQGFGRLVRTERDRGIVAILDPRIVQKAYGKTLLASLPDASRCYSLEEVRAFYAAAMQRGVTA